MRLHTLIQHPVHTIISKFFQFQVFIDKSRHYYQIIPLYQATTIGTGFDKELQ